MGIVVPDHVAVHKWASEKGYSDIPFSTLCDHKQQAGASPGPTIELQREREARELLRATILSDLQAIGKESLLKGYEQVRS